MPKRKTQEEFKKELKEKYPDFELVSVYINQNTPVQIKCKNNHIFSVTPHNILRQGKECPYCSKKILIKGVNTVGDLRPDLIQYFKNKEDSFNVSLMSHKRVLLKCPYCGLEKELEVKNFVKNGFFCKNCSDNISLPNKIERAIYRQLALNNIIADYDFEFMPKWIKKFKYRYDGVFFYNGRMYLEENQGIQHYEEKSFGNKERQLGQIQLRDKRKRDLAKENKTDLLIINCNFDSLKQIENSFVIEFLKIGINLNLYIDWIEVEKFLMTSLMKEICLYYEIHKPITLRQLSEIFKINRGTISKYLNKGNKLGFCNYNYKDNLKYGGSLSKPNTKNSYNAQV